MIEDCRKFVAAVILPDTLAKTSRAYEHYERVKNYDLSRLQKYPVLKFNVFEYK